MPKLLPLAAVAAAALGLAGTAEAGCMATVGLSPLPKAGHAAGKPWVVTVRVLQHGRTPLANATPTIRIRNAAGKLFTFRARPTARVGSYRARVVFPKPGRYALAVHDGFPYSACARIHTFRAVTIVGV